MNPCVRFLVACALAAGLSPTFAAPAAPSSRPSDEQVKKDIWRDGKGMLAFKTTAGKSGELEWDAKTQTWFFQRGFVVTREGGLADYPGAKLEVGGLAIYRHSGGNWAFQKQLTTFNRYTGIPAPSDDELLALARSNPERVFRQHHRNMPAGLGPVVLSKELGPRWHNANSMSFWVEASYDFRIESTRAVVACTTQSEVRIYRNNPDSPWRDATGLGMKVLAGCGAPGR